MHCIAGSGDASVADTCGTTGVPWQRTSAEHGAEFHSITAMPVYRGMSFEELRWRDYEVKIMPHLLNAWTLLFFSKCTVNWAKQACHGNYDLAEASLHCIFWKVVAERLSESSCILPLPPRFTWRYYQGIIAKHGLVAVIHVYFFTKLCRLTQTCTKS